jgi:hypothetical protein
VNGREKGKKGKGVGEYSEEKKEGWLTKLSNWLIDLLILWQQKANVQNR